MATRKDNSGRPQITNVTPPASIPGGEFRIQGRGFSNRAERPHVTIGDVPAHLLVGSESLVIAKVPEGASVGELIVQSQDRASDPWVCDIGIQIMDSIHAVSSPAVDKAGNIYTTMSGSRGQKTPVAVYKIDLNYTPKALVTDLMNATALTFDHDGILHVSSRYDGIVYQVSASGTVSVFVEGMGVATGLAFDRDGFLYVGDRSGTIFKVGRDRSIYVFATIEPSMAAFHLAFGPDGHLYVSGPTTSSFDTIHRISPAGEVEIFYRGLGRPQGIAFDSDGRLYVAASLGGLRGVVRIDESRKAELYLSGPNIVGLCFSPSRSMVVATSNALYRVDAELAPLMLF